MSDQGWHAQVAALLEQAAEALRARRYRRVIVALGTAVAYVEQARDRGDEFARELLSHTIGSQKDDPTQRFTFQPGELEELVLSSDKK
jgi:hypothetical protein